MRNVHHTQDVNKQHKKYANPKTNFSQRAYHGGPNKKAESSLNNMIKRQLMPLGDVKMKNVVNNTPNDLKPSHKVYLETKAMFNAVKHHGITSYTKKL